MVDFFHEFVVHTVATLSSRDFDGREVLPARRRADAEDVFHHEQFRLEVGDVLEVLLVQRATRVVDQPFAVVRTVALADLTEALTGGPRRSLRVAKTFVNDEMARKFRSQFSTLRTSGRNQNLGTLIESSA